MSKKTTHNEDGAAEQTTVTLAHGALVNGEYVSPGETITVTADDADALRASGYVAGEDGTASGAAGS